MHQARNTRNRKNCIELMEGKEGREFILFDTETTGKDPSKDYIIELAALKIRIVNKKAQVKDQIDCYIKPPVQMDEKVIAIHHITNEFLMDHPPETQAFPGIERFFGDRPILLAYNADFDVGFLKALYARQGGAIEPETVLDVREMGYDLFNGADFKDHKLGTLVTALGLDAGL